MPPEGAGAGVVEEAAGAANREVVGAAGAAGLGAPKKEGAAGAGVVEEEGGAPKRLEVGAAGAAGAL